MVMRLTSHATPWPLLAVALLCMAAGAGAGYALKARLAQADLARAQTALAEERARCAAERESAAREVAERLARAQDAERTAVHALHATRARLRDTQGRLHDALSAIDDRGCGLSGPARGLLNDAIAQGGAGLPAGAAQSAGAAATPAADSAGTGERDLAFWIADAITAYGECRARLDAIRQWDEVTHGR